MLILMLAIFTYVGVEVSIQSNLGELLKFVDEIKDGVEYNSLGLVAMSDREIMNAKKAHNRKSILFRDPVVERVVDKFVQRSDLGFDKYGRTLHDERTGGHKDLLGYLNDVQEELMDAILYIQTARELIDEVVGTQDNS